MKNKVLKQMLAFSLAVALVGEIQQQLLLLSQLTEQSQVQIRKQQQMQPLKKLRQLISTFENGKFDNGKNYAQYQLRAGDVQDLPKVTVDDGYEFLGWKVSGKK